MVNEEAVMEMIGKLLSLDESMEALFVKVISFGKA